MGQLTSADVSYQWVVVAIKTSCFHMYNTFECHFKPNQKSQSDMTDPVLLILQCQYLLHCQFFWQHILGEVILAYVQIFIPLVQCIDDNYPEKKY